MQDSKAILCDGCGQSADQEHVARRLKRLENMTRYRPIHVQALFLGAASPAADADHLYSAVDEFRGEGLALLRALGIDPRRKSVEAVLADFQRRGYLLTYLLECPNQSIDSKTTQELLGTRLAPTSVRIRRSLKPKKLVLLDRELDPVVEKLAKETVGAELVVSQNGHAFRLEELAPGSLEAAIRVTPVASL
jgi:hypothetical protein